jgi:hypothetical protein
MWPQEEIDALCKPFGVVERQRKLPLGMFVGLFGLASRAARSGGMDFKYDYVTYAPAPATTSSRRRERSWWSGMGRRGRGADRPVALDRYPPGTAR